MAFGSLLHTNLKTDLTTSASTTLGTAAVLVGNIAVIVLGIQANQTAAVPSDDLGNTWVTLTATRTATTISLNVAYSIITVPGTMSAKWSFASTSAQKACCIAVFDGSLLSTPKDVEPAATSGSASPYSCPASGALAQPSELVIGCMGMSVGGAILGSGSNTLAQACSTGTSAGTVASAIGYQVTSATSTVTPQFTAPNNTAVMKTFSIKSGFVPSAYQLRQAVNRAAIF